jgi:hypothetical protein
MEGIAVQEKMTGDSVSKTAAKLISRLKWRDAIFVSIMATGELVPWTAAKPSVYFSRIENHKLLSKLK